MHPDEWLILFLPGFIFFSSDEVIIIVAQKHSNLKVDFERNFESFASRKKLLNEVSR